MIVRPETPADVPAVRSLFVEAFDSQAEANLVDTLREQATPIVSLVAEDFGQILGYILFSPVTLEGDQPLFAMGLAPMAVRPDRQKTTIGSRLVTTGLDACRDLHVGACFVLGHPAYYPRFGFEPAVNFGIRSVYEVPDDTFMALELEKGVLKDKSGVVHYHEAFGNL